MEQERPTYLIQIPPEDWEKTPDSVKKLMEEMAQRLEKLEQQQAEVLAAQQQLLEKVNRTSKNSSSPPSQDPARFGKKQQKQKSSKGKSEIQTGTGSSSSSSDFGTLSHKRWLLRLVSQGRKHVQQKLSRSQKTFVMSKRVLGVYSFAHHCLVILTETCGRGTINV